jgi:hypothetical protein
VLSPAAVHEDCARDRAHHRALGFIIFARSASGAETGLSDPRVVDDFAAAACQGDAALLGA